MGLPTEEDNLAGYKNASLLNKVHKIKSNKLLLVHGSSDGKQKIREYEHGKIDEINAHLNRQR